MINHLLPRLSMQLRWQDPRLYQISVLAFLLLYSQIWLDFALPPGQVLAILLTVLLTQALWTGMWRLPAYDPYSALISGLSLCLLLRATSWHWAAITALITISSKFVLRWRGKHLFNPSNFGLVIMLGCTQQVWISPGQWGSVVWLACVILAWGPLVVQRAMRSDVTYTFFAFYVAIQISRALWLGDPLTIPWHALQNGTFLVFTFFMISDPKTTPASRPGRVLFALLVALGAAYGQFVLYERQALLWALAAVSVIVPVLDWLLPGRRYTWPSAAVIAPSAQRGEAYVMDVARYRAAAEPAAQRPASPGFLRFLRRQGRYQAVQQSLPGGSGTPGA